MAHCREKYPNLATLFGHKERGKNGKEMTAEIGIFSGSLSRQRHVRRYFVTSGYLRSFLLLSAFPFFPAIVRRHRGVMS